MDTADYHRELLYDGEEFKHDLGWYLSHFPLLRKKNFWSYCLRKSLFTTDKVRAIAYLVKNGDEKEVSLLSKIEDIPDESVAEETQTNVTSALAQRHKRKASNRSNALVLRQADVVPNALALQRALNVTNTAEKKNASYGTNVVEEKLAPNFTSSVADEKVANVTNAEKSAVNGTKTTYPNPVPVENWYKKNWVPVENWFKEKWVTILLLSGTCLWVLILFCNARTICIYWENFFNPPAALQSIGQ